MMNGFDAINNVCGHSLDFNKDYENVLSSHTINVYVIIMHTMAKHAKRG